VTCINYSSAETVTSVKCKLYDSFMLFLVRTIKQQNSGKNPWKICKHHEQFPWTI